VDQGKVVTGHDISEVSPIQNLPLKGALRVAAVPPFDSSYSFREDNHIFKKLTATDVRWFG
jgi:hypothetical protein